MARQRKPAWPRHIIDDNARAMALSADEAIVNCGRCEHLTDFHSDRQVGYCVKISRMMATWKDVICPFFIQKG